MRPMAVSKGSGWKRSSDSDNLHQDEHWVLGSADYMAANGDLEKTMVLGADSLPYAAMKRVL